jgi:hypothetical protein
LNKLRGRLTYANVMATIAVFIALGGASYAAVKLPKNSVGPKQLKRSAVTTAKIKNQAVTTEKLAPGAVTPADGSIGTAKLADGAVTGTKVADGSLGAADLAAGVLPPDRIIPISVNTPAEPSPEGTTVLQAEGLSLTVFCLDVSAESELGMFWRTATDNAHASRLLSAVGIQDFDVDLDFDSGEAFVGNNQLSVPATAVTSYLNAAGGSVLVHWSYMATASTGRCLLNGYAVVDPAG